MSLLQIRDLRKKYGQQLVLQQQTLDIPSGIHLLTGPNGSGKSTFLKILAGLIPFEGRIVLKPDIRLGKDHRAHRQAISYCESEPAFPAYLSGNYLVDMYINLKGGSEQQLAELKESLGIAHFLEQKISSYSSGMKKKLALLLAFVGKPTLILLDEPFNALDKEAKKGLEQLILQQSSHQVSFILATHIHGQQPQLPIRSAISVEQQGLILSPKQRKA